MKEDEDEGEEEEGEDDELLYAALWGWREGLVQAVG